ncbi:ABC transporter ATP-binding protein [Bradyrhizobium sp. NP1]|uniref:ABC transporter ATP-binding protein n=1 Tax=Bradyrhizobium sp. NP1 TaxID=3049772 RepID=UPI0025A6403D|nr:ABC transporter ATP-binding protein [Bradyrhizobium sp. NP1]WJR79810.1 ABC transporter ATP-binding protein [Bradyrhizobium sp. NP1]
MLVVNGLNAWYARSHVIQDVTFEVERGEIVTLLGRNGAGKTTTLRAIMGLVARRSGSVTFKGSEILPRPTWKRFVDGLAYVPEQRGIVPGLTVLENLRLGLVAAPSRLDEQEVIDRMASTFPRLKQRLNQEAVTLSGGEQQMLAIARAMASGPSLVMLDEPSEGIMPVLVKEMFDYFARLRDQGTTILLVEQNVELALKISDRAYIIDQGQIVHEGRAASLLADAAIQEKYCSV